MSPRACRGAAALALLLLAAPGGAATTDNVLARVRGTVTYGPRNAAPTLPLVGRIGIPGDTRVATAFRAAASVTLPDSSVIEIGDRSDVSVGAFAAARNGRQNTVVVQRGAVRFTIRRPRGGVSNYTFATPTTQVAVRGTRGDVAVVVDGVQYRPVSGETVDVRIVGRARNAAIVPNDTINNPAIDQFLDGRSPFGEPASEGSDPTGSGSGTP